MSEAYVEADAEAADDENDDLGAPASEDEEGGDEGDEGDKPAKRTDWEKLAHNREGQAARERSRRRAAERKNSELEERIARIEAAKSGPDQDELLEIIAGLRDDDEDPVGDIANVKKALKAFRARQLEETQEVSQRTALERQFTKLRDAMTEAEADFRADAPDYPDAAKFYREQRQAELEDAGYTGQALQRKLADDLFGIVRMSLEAGMDPAERVYGLAKRRGFKANSSVADKKVDVLKRAAEASRRPASSGAGRSDGVLTWEDVAKLDGAARDKAWEKLRSREKGKR